MSHLLASSNPAAVDRMNGEARPLPGIGEVVLYHPRQGEVRQGRVTVPGIVLHRDEENRHLELLVIHAADDMINQARVPEHVAGDRGWSRQAAESDAARVDALEKALAIQNESIELLKNSVQLLGDSVAMVFGDFELPAGESAMSLIAKLDDRIGEVEDSQPAAAETVKAPVAVGLGRRRAKRSKVA